LHNKPHKKKQLGWSKSMTTNTSAARHTIQGLSLYYYDSCPFCNITLQVLQETGLDVALRHIQRQPHHRTELIKQGGRGQVPCLRIDLAEGKTIWLYESRDIMQFMRAYATEIEKDNNSTAA